MSNERRRHRRFTLQLDVSIRVGDQQQPIRGNLLELSVGGGFLAAPVDVPDGHPVSIRFRYQNEHPCQATGHVIRSIPFGQNQGIALSFGVANPTLQALLRTLAQMPPALQPDVMTAIDEVEIHFE